MAPLVNPLPAHPLPAPPASLFATLLLSPFPASIFSPFSTSPPLTL